MKVLRDKLMLDIYKSCMHAASLDAQSQGEELSKVFDKVKEGVEKGVLFEKDVEKVKELAAGIMVLTENFVSE